MGRVDGGELLGPTSHSAGQRQRITRDSPEWLLWLGIREALLCTLRAVETYMGLPVSLPSKRRGRSPM